jgi:hypothetical protein
MDMTSMPSASVVCGSGHAPLLVLTLAVALLGGCAGKTTRWASITRYRATNSAGPARLPICGTADRSVSLAEQEQNKICFYAAKKKGVAIAYDEDQRCLQPTMVWDVDTEGAKGECHRAAFAGVECDSRYIYRHSLKLTLVDSEDQTPVVEAQAATTSDRGDLNAAISYALCTAAFFSHPQVVHNKYVKVDYAK